MRAREKEREIRRLAKDLVISIKVYGRIGRGSPVYKRLAALLGV